MTSYTPTSSSSSAPEPAIAGLDVTEYLSQSSNADSFQCPAQSPVHTSERYWAVFAAAIFLVSVPVFIQAPLVRSLPWLSLALTLGWLGLGRWLQAQEKSRVWGDLLIGFAWTWLAGSLYWGWLRWEPFLHLPVEAIALPFILVGMTRQQGKRRANQVGDWFYLGSLAGTVLTDIYFYLVDLIPYWRTLMKVDEQSAQPIFQSAIAQIQTSWGIGWATTLATLLLVVGVLPLRSQRVHWWAFSGAVLSTLLVDGLFWLVASLA